MPQPTASRTGLGILMISQSMRILTILGEAGYRQFIPIHSKSKADRIAGKETIFRGVF